MDPFLADKGSSLLKPVLDVLFKPVADAFSYAVQDFHSSMKAKIGEDKFNERDYSSALDWTDWEMAVLKYLVLLDVSAFIIPVYFFCSYSIAGGARSTGPLCW